MNPSMEDYVECPRVNIPIHHSIEMAEYWTTPTFSSDYYSTCRVGAYRVPEAGNGYQYPRTGNAYVGAYMWRGLNQLNRLEAEYIEGTLSSVLEKDSFYLVDFYINRAGENATNIAIDQISLVFTANHIIMPYSESPPFGASLYITTPDLISPEGVFYIDTLNWERIKWIYQARGDEAFFTVGIFRPESEINYIAVNENFAAYGVPLYYFDDFRVEKIPRYQAWSGLGQDTLICLEDFEMELVGNENHFHYRWSTGDTTRQITIDSPGLYTLESWFADSCVVVDSIRVEQFIPGSVDLGEDVLLCPADLPLLLSGNVSQGSFLWSTGDTLSEIAVEEEGEYWLEVTTPCGSYRDSILIEVQYPPLLDIGQDTLICGEDEIDLWITANEGYLSYEWNNGSTDRALHITEPGWYWVDAVHQCGSIRDSFLVRHQALEVLDLGEDTTLCFSTPIIITAQEGYDTYLWNTGEHTPMIEITDYGIYSLIAGNECGTMKDTILIEAPPSWDLIAPDRLLVGWDESQQILVETTGTLQDPHYHWQPTEGLSCTDCLQPTVSPTQSTQYTLTATDEYGCESQVSTSVEVVVPHDIYFPNAFSPNDDGINDFFGPLYGNEVLEVKSLQIYNRWGDRVFSTKYDFKWAGDWKGKKAESAIYVYQAEVVFADGRSEIVSGELLLVR